ncbi:DNA-binding protein WhiA [Haloplasma contractile]|uniref:Probable cell division protein WhiA n=1 Tax=Haloplasma contractile SSD-17B TaxID=1033810 RepID=U2E7T6_9MOLU|nr:DNA-binding protein WhiA [Haloplasma contractile]ERJ10956.1 Putative sporulation transcription regulator WhiA protein [Haloplasma contractile SSD-17B]ERJ12964.1 Putative sporulation transcription regulator WhiA protein [Haloplasma contractile SSD-17B]
MSFASETKNELVSLSVSECCAKAELSALIRMNGIINLSNQGLRIEFQTQNATIARRFVKLVKQLYDIHVDLLTRKRMRLNKGNVYIVRISRFAKMIIDDLGLMHSGGFEFGIPAELIESDCCKRAYLRGAFLAGGSVNNPSTSSYHLEIFSLDEELVNGIRDLMNGVDLNAKTLTRKKGYIVYVKESEKISDFLRVIQATHAVFDFEDVRIYRDMNNSVNRIRNCEMANLNKSWSAATSQIEDIKLIEKTLGLEILGDKLLEIAELRINYPDSTLSELSDISKVELDKQISKSGINHRLRKIKQMAKRIRESEPEEQA